MHPTRTLSPKAFAEVIGVSESSIRRWVDDGLINVMRTAGGHRRILLTEAMRFIRNRELRVLRPELLGLPDLTDLPPERREDGLTGDVLFHLLMEHEAARVRGLILRSYLEETRLGALFDGPMAEALGRLGALWKHSEEGIFREHQATLVCIEAVHQLRALISPPHENAPLAVGGAPSSDPYMLPGLMASAVLADQGYREVNLGPDTPPSAFLAAVEEHQPDLVWLSLTAHLQTEQIESVMHDLIEPLKDREVQIVIGGQGAVHRRNQWPDVVRVLTTMQAFEAYLSEQQSDQEA